MFENPGASIKKVATILFVIELVLSVSLAISLIVSGTGGYAGRVVAGIVVLIVGPIFSWVGGVCLYGFGQLIENSDKQTVYARKSYEASVRPSDAGHDEVQPPQPPQE